MNNKFPAVAVITMGVLFMAMTPSKAIPPDLEEFIDSYQRVWNRHNGEALAELFLEDADMIIGSGPLVQGRAAIADWWQAYFAHLDRGRRGGFFITSARMVSPEVAVINIDSTTSGDSHDDERELPVRKARGTWVVVHLDDRWMIAALRAQPAEGESRTAPGTDR